MRLSLRYDMRAPSIGPPAQDLYEAAIEQCAWGDARGFGAVYIAEHHGADDGYCASPMILASAIASRTQRMRLQFHALVAVLHHPLRLAEDLATLDIISRGRVAMTLGLGYLPHEFAMFGIEQSGRGALLEEIVATLKLAWTGEPFSFRGERVKVRPVPVQDPRPPIFIGGSGPVSARRAARIGDGYTPAAPPDLRAELYQLFLDEREQLGLPAPEDQLRHAGPLFLHITDDPDRAWNQVGPHLLYTAQSYNAWAKKRSVGATPYPAAKTVSELRDSDVFAVVTPEECVTLAESLGTDAELFFQPLFGGIPPEVAWPSLELFADEVAPRLRELGLLGDDGSARLGSSA